MSYSVRFLSIFFLALIRYFIFYFFPLYILWFTYFIAQLSSFHFTILVVSIYVPDGWWVIVTGRWQRRWQRHLWLQVSSTFMLLNISFKMKWNKYKEECNEKKNFKNAHNHKKIIKPYFLIIIRKINNKNEKQEKQNCKGRYIFRLDSLKQDMLVLFP